MDKIQSKVVDHLVALLESVLEVHTLKEDELSHFEKMYSDKRIFREQHQILKLSLPRRAGHTTAALEILQIYSRALLITRTTRVSNLRKQGPDEWSQIMTIDEACSEHSNTVLRILGILGHIDFILLDTVFISQSEVDTLFNLYSPKIVVLLGDSKIVQ